MINYYMENGSVLMGTECLDTMFPGFLCLVHGIQKVKKPKFPNCLLSKLESNTT